MSVLNIFLAFVFAVVTAVYAVTSIIPESGYIGFCAVFVFSGLLLNLINRGPENDGLKIGFVSAAMTFAFLSVLGSFFIGDTIKASTPFLVVVILQCGCAGLTALYFKMRKDH